MTTTSIDDFEKDLDAIVAEDEARRRAAEQAREAERDQRMRDAEKKAAWARFERERPHREAIAEALVALGHAVSSAVPVGRDPARAGFPVWSMVVDRTLDVSHMINLDAEYGGSGTYFRKPTGKLRLLVTAGGENKSYPQRRDGTFNYEDAARLIAREVGVKAAQARAEALRASNGSTAAEVAAYAESLGFKKYGSTVSVEATSFPEQPVVLYPYQAYHPRGGYARGGFSVTADQARRILDILAEKPA